MADPSDMIIPMLQRIQSDMSEMKRDTRERLERLDGRIGNLEERFEALGPYITYTMGLHGQNRADVEVQAAELSDIKRRLDQLEARQPAG